MSNQTPQEQIENCFAWAAEHVRAIEYELRAAPTAAIGSAEREERIARCEVRLRFLRNCLWHLAQLLGR